MTLSAATGLSALAAGFSGWFLLKATTAERVALVAAGLALLYPNVLHDVIGLGLFAAVAIVEYFRRRRLIERHPDQVG
jgi:TRAP-type uncharacterized transport system fused permease subunit